MKCKGLGSYEIVFGAVLEYFGKEKLVDLIPSGDYDIPTITEGKYSNRYCIVK